ncbi:MAG: restriction endonuclease subunit S [Rhodocyclaceae bacterium]|nr:restriction endonuclease subunit S [Rhodocyclaceae bacterium]
MTSQIPKGWKRAKLGSVIDLVSGQHIQVDDCNADGRGVPYLTGPADFENGVIRSSKFTEVPQICCKAGDILITVKGSGTGSTVTADAEYCISRQLMAVRARNSDSAFIRFVLESHAATYNNISAGLIPGIARDDVLNTRLAVPPIAEQQKIGALLAMWADAIDKIEQLIAAKNQCLNHLREHHLTKQNQFTRIKLKAATRESTARNGKRLGREAIMAVTKQVGMRPMREETIAAAIDRYKVVRPRAFAYNPMRLNIGSIATSSFDDDVLVSPDYVVFECDEAKLLPGYLNHLRRTRHWASHFEAAGSGGVRIRIYYDDLGAFAFPLPPLAEQERVLAVLDAGVTEIETLESYLAALKKQKRGLMQKLLTGQWRVPVESKAVAA